MSLSVPPPNLPPASAKTHYLSPISTSPHDPHLTMASGIVLDHLGPTVQTVFDCLSSRGPVAYSQLLFFLTAALSKPVSADRKAAVRQTKDFVEGFGGLRSQEAIDTESCGYVVAETSIKGAL